MQVGIIGGGQLGRMLALAGYPLGLRFRFFDPAPDAPAGVLAEHIAAPYDDIAALCRFAAGLDVVTYEFEHVPLASAEKLAELLPVYPPIAALSAAQDRLTEKQFFQQLGIPTAPFAPVGSQEELVQAVAHCGMPALLKTRQWGYDGKGQAFVTSLADVQQAWERLDNVSCILEGLVDFDRELSLVAVQGRDGKRCFYPLVENHHQQGILHHSLAPAPNLTMTLQTAAEGYATLVLEALGYVGVLTIEFFATKSGLLANEMAPRVHNSGHWTIEGAETSQFANHLRAIVGLPLGSPTPVGTCEMINILGFLPHVGDILATPNAHLHLYDKAQRPGRKIGHVTYVRRLVNSS